MGSFGCLLGWVQSNSIQFNSMGSDGGTFERGGCFCDGTRTVVLRPASGFRFWFFFFVLVGASPTFCAAGGWMARNLIHFRIRNSMTLLAPCLPACLPGTAVVGASCLSRNRDPFWLNLRVRAGPVFPLFLRLRRDKTRAFHTGICSTSAE